MSRAFTREVDDAPPPPILERAISSARNLVTPNGARQIEQAMETLDRQIEASGDNDALATISRELRYWHARHARMEIVEPPEAPITVTFGTHVTIKRGGEAKHLHIVGEDEADPAVGTIAWTSPLARALEGARPGDVVEFEAGGREEEILVLSVKGASG